MSDFYFQAIVYLIAAVISVPLAKKLGLGSVLGYLLAGAAIGPFAFGFIGSEGEDIMHFAEFGVAIMLFLVGLELDLSRLWKMRNSILGFGGTQVIATAALITLIASVVGVDLKSSIAIGFTFSLSSTAIALQILNEKGYMTNDAGVKSFSVLLFQDIAVIPMLALFPLLATIGVASNHSSSASWIAGYPIWVQTMALFASFGIMVTAGRFLLRPILRIVAKTEIRELFTAAALLLVIASAVFMTKMGLSPALGTFMAGILLAGSEYRHELESDIEPFKGLLLGLFFIAVGASLNFQLIGENPGTVASIVFALIFVKFIVMFSLGRIFKMSYDNNIIFSSVLAQGGEFAFVLFSFSVQNGILDQATVAPLIASVAISMAFTPIIMLFNERVILPYIGVPETQKREADKIEEKGSVIIAGFGSFGNIIGRFLRANGVLPTVLDNDPDRVDLLRKLGLKVYYGDATRLDLLKKAGAAKARIIILAMDDPEKNIEIAGHIKKHFPKLTILSRALHRPDAYKLLELGVKHVYRHTLDTSLRVGVDALTLLGNRGFQAHRAAQSFRNRDESALRDLSKLKHDSKDYLNQARQVIRDLEKVMLKEAETKDLFKDIGWDSESLRVDVLKNYPK
ncbi:MAG: monovalent cation:proton antiporter-2 (CPA2) family protein [Leptospirales bacterium]